jgi:hypothetical protein
MGVYYIGADVHSNNTEPAVEYRGKIVQRRSVATTIHAIRQVLDRLDGRKYLTLEEEPLAGWLYRNLVDHVQELVVCDPRHNRWIASDGDRDDRISATKLAVLLRGQYLRAVHHSRDERLVRVKRWVRLGPPNATPRIKGRRRGCRACRRTQVPALRAGHSSLWANSMKDVLRTSAGRPRAGDAAFTRWRAGCRDT